MEHLMGCHGEWQLIAALAANTTALFAFVRTGFGIIEWLPDADGDGEVP